LSVLYDYIFIITLTTWCT